MSQDTSNSKPKEKRRLFNSAAAIAAAGFLAFLGRDTAAQDSRPEEDREDDPRDDFKKSKPGRSPHTTPFVVPLPVYLPKEPVSHLRPVPTREAAKDEAGRLPHQAWDRFPPRKFYELNVREGNHSFHPELPTQKIWGYDGVHPGPTFVARYGEPVLVRIENNLPSNHVGFGSPEITTHLHNGHTPSESDGFAADYYSRTKFGATLTRAGRYKDHHYPNIYANLAGFTGTNGDPNEALGTLWYHDHRMEFTAPNIYRGLAGFYLLFDELDSGNENDPPPALGLPSGVGRYDIPLLFQDKNFDSSGYLFFNQLDAEGILGEKFLVNGKIQPYFDVEPRKYRFRMLNGGPQRFYEFYLVYRKPDQSYADQNFWYIANDGNLLEAPLETNKVRIAVAERGDVVIDFSRYPIGSQLFLVNRLEHLSGRGPTGALVQPGTQILRFDVKEGDPAQPDNSRVPKTLRPLRPVSSKGRRVRKWEFDRENDVWTVNGKLFDETKPAAVIKLGEEEIWELQGKGSWSHPIHIHFEEMRILSRNGLPPPPHERGRKDIFELRPGELVRLHVRFRDFVGKYMMHCHNTVHEDHHMMVRFDVVP